MFINNLPDGGELIYGTNPSEQRKNYYKYRYHRPLWYLPIIVVLSVALLVYTRSEVCLALLSVLYLILIWFCERGIKTWDQL